MYDLFTFYRSKEWRALLQTLKLERLNDAGEIICEYCGQPITRAYDLIGHHKEELTLDNVNDPNVSLNPDNIAFVHHRCHNFIHNKLGRKMQGVFIVYGAPLAGKSSWVEANRTNGDLVVDIDDIWQCVSGCDRYIKPNGLKSVVFKVRDTLLEAVKYRLGKWSNAYIVGGYPLQAERERLCKEFGAREIFIEATEDECLARLYQLDTMPDKRDFERYISEWFARYNPPPLQE